MSHAELRKSVEIYEASLKLGARIPTPECCVLPQYEALPGQEKESPREAVS